MKNLLGFALGLAALLSACNHADTKSESVGLAAPASMAVMSAPPYSSDKAEESEANQVSAPLPVSTTPTARLLIYHADLRLKVANIAQTSNRLDSLVRRSGGYLSAATETREENEWRQQMTIRVQPGRFQSVLTAVSQLGTVEEKKLSTDDVTAEHADVAARLRTKRAVEQRYVALLTQARKISEILEVEAKIAQVREEIESTESRLKTLNDEVSYSTITLTCYQPLAQPTPDVPIVSLGSRLVEAFYGGWSLLTSLLVGTVAIWPLLLLGVVTWWAVRRWRRASLLKVG